MVGIDAAVVANHRVVVRRPRAGEPGEVIDDLEPVPTLAGRDRLSARGVWVRGNYGQIPRLAVEPTPRS
jgi:hypothetical protein